METFKVCCLKSGRLENSAGGSICRSERHLFCGSSFRDLSCLRLPPSSYSDLIRHFSAQHQNVPLSTVSRSDAFVISCQNDGSKRRSESLVASSVRLVKESGNGAVFSRFNTPFSTQILTEKDTELKEEVDFDSLPGGGLVEEGMVYRERFVIRCYEVGTNKTASIESIANLMQEIGCNHAQSVGFSNDGFATTPLMRENRLIWVTTRMHIEMEQYPAWGDVVEIDTWFQGEGHIKTRRDWIIKMGNSGKVIGRGTSSWVAMNKDTRRMSKLSAEIQAEFTCFCPVPPRFALSHDSLVKVPSLEDPAESVCSYLRPRRGDLDMNQHVNNVTYIGWMLESVPSKVFEEAELSQITLEYRREVSGGEMVESLSSFESSSDSKPANGSSVAFPQNGSAVATDADRHTFVHLLRLQDSSKEINRGRTVWRRKTYCDLK